MVLIKCVRHSATEERTAPLRMWLPFSSNIVFFFSFFFIQGYFNFSGLTSNCLLWRGIGNLNHLGFLCMAHRYHPLLFKTAFITAREDYRVPPGSHSFVCRSLLGLCLIFKDDQIQRQLLDFDQISGLPPWHFKVNLFKIPTTTSRFLSPFFVKAIGLVFALGATIKCL